MLSGVGGSMGPGVPGESEKLLWDPTDITAHKNRYKWTLRPTTTEVRLAQEDLWILDQICRVIAEVNGKTPPYLRPIKVVKKIALEGYALDGSVNGQPKGIGTNRVLRPGAAATSAGTPAEGGETTTADGSTGDGATGEGAPVEGAPVISAPPTRLGNAFSSGGGGERGGEMSAPVATEGGEAPVDGAAPAARKRKADLYRMVPFKIQLHILQSSLPKLMEAIKNSPLTMEINQVRINPETNAANQFANLSKTPGGDGGLSREYSSGAGAGSVGLLPGEIMLELHGVVYIATPYDEKKLPPPDSAAAEPDAT
jgi:hypothetical protein